MRTKPRLVIDPSALKRRRLSRVLTPEQLAEAASLSLPRLRKIESGWGGGVSVKAVQRLAAVLECQPEDISYVEEVAS